MRFVLTFTGDAKDRTALEKIVGVMKVDLAAVAVVDVRLDYLPDPAPVKQGPIDFTTESIDVSLDITDVGTVVAVSARSGVIAASGASVAAAMAAVAVIAAKPVPIGIGQIDEPVVPIDVAMVRLP